MQISSSDTVDAINVYKFVQEAKNPSPLPIKAREITQTIQK